MNLENQIETGVVDSIEAYRKRRPSITLIVDREVVAPVLFRNSAPDRAETQEFDGTLHAQVNPEKFISKERLTGLDLLRRLTEKYGDENDKEWTDYEYEGDVPRGLISDIYTYNNPDSMAVSMNHDSLTYGLVGTGDYDYGIKSRVIQGYTYSLNEYDILDSETRNAVYETGTMKDADNEQSSSLFERVSIKPENRFLHFVTIESGTVGMLAYTLHNILNTSCYGARGTRAGKTLQNNILGVVVSESPVHLSTAEYMLKYKDGDKYSGLEDYISDSRKSDWSVYGEKFEDNPEWLNELFEVAGRKKEDSDEVLYELLRNDLESCIEGIQDSVR